VEAQKKFGNALPPNAPVATGLIDRFVGGHLLKLPTASNLPDPFPASIAARLLHPCPSPAAEQEIKNDCVFILNFAAAATNIHFHS